MRLRDLGLFAVPALTATAATASFGMPTLVSVSPPNGARFMPGQRFDLRVEGKGVGPYSASLAIDGIPVSFTSGTQNTTTTDGISGAGFGGFNVRGYSNMTPGIHKITASFSDSTGIVNVTTRFQIVSVHSGGRPVKNIIIMLGDGMGVAHRTAARIVKQGVYNNDQGDAFAMNGDPKGPLAMDLFPGTGWVSTHSLNSIVTDSAPGMSCYTTGNHQNNNQEGVFPANVTNPFFAPRVEYLGEYLHRTQGKSLGLVSTADVEDATIAANAAHTLARGAGQGICDQYFDERGNTGLSVLLGGGRRWFLPQIDGQGNVVFGSSRSAANDYPALPNDLVTAWRIPASGKGAIDANRNLLQDFTNAGFTYTANRSELKTACTRSAPNKLLGLFGFGNMNVALDKLAKQRNTLLPGASTFAVDDYHAPDQPMLDEMADAAIRVLSRNREGFVLMVEGAHIDKQSHLMDAERAVDETIEFDNAVDVARCHADRLGNTLVIVLADHECSGFSLIGALTGGIEGLRALPSDTGVVDPATKPGRQAVVGTYDSAGFPKYAVDAQGYPLTFDINGKLLVGYGANADRYEGWQTHPYPVVDSLLPGDVRSELQASGKFSDQPKDRAAKDPVPYGDSQGFFVRGQAAGRDNAVHTATDIPVSAYSSGHSKTYQLFIGVQKNTDIFFKLMRAAVGGFM